MLAESVGLALLVVLETPPVLGFARTGGPPCPAERVAFVLHDLFGAPFERIAAITDRSLPAAKKLASRARRKVRGTPALPAAEQDRHRGVVEAFLAAARGGDLGAPLGLLAPDVVRHADPATLPPGMATELRGARAVAEGTVLLRERARFAVPALVDGRVGLVVVPRGRLRYVLRVTVEGDRAAAYEVVADPVRLRGLEAAVLDAPAAA
ncbi:sigma factor-like helix-turn-helix DNA-binding protein [Streptomyces sp. NPDC013157]|uniref:sigma factor-like helix-turn-helix DNA-binding protein n=1 Tax=Streptomyces sp. NPDC013157 TaxID=3364861 RepID=UPI00368949D6